MWLFLPFIAFLSFCTLGASSSSSSSSGTQYEPLPEGFSLVVVFVLTRHGDRTQITRELGPKIPESNKITEFWNNRLPHISTLRNMAASAAPASHSDGDNPENLRKRLYVGWDHIHSPYGQLTELGAQQLVEVGKTLRQRYVSKFLPESLEEAAEVLYCRSTHICRTIQSLRSLLVGMYDIDGAGISHMTSIGGGRKKQRFLTADSHNHDFSDNQGRNRSLEKINFVRKRRPYIMARPRSYENMFPYADGPCAAMGERRSRLIANNYNNATNIPPWSQQLEIKMKKYLGFRDRVNWLNWLNIMEILTCYEIHNVTLPYGITHEDVQRTHYFVSWMWGQLYKDTLLARLAVGRYIQDLLDDLHSVVAKVPKLVPWDVGSSSGKSQIIGSNSQHSNINGNTITINSNSNSNSNSNHNSTGNQGSRGSPMNERNWNPKTTAKMLLYSGHDSTIVPLMVALGLNTDEWPPYAAYIVFEVALSHKDNSYYVRASYIGNDILMKGCKTLWCPYDQFVRQIGVYAMTEAQYQHECRSSNSTNWKKSESSDATSNNLGPTRVSETGTSVRGTEKLRGWKSIFAGSSPEKGF